VLKVSRKKRSGFKKTSKRRKSPETSTTMPPGRVFALAPGGSKRLLEVEEPARTRATRQKPNAIPVTNDKVISANADRVIPATGDNEEQLLHQNEDSLLHMGDGYHSMDEASTGHMQLSPLAPNAGISEEPEEPCTDEGKFICYSFTSSLPKFKQCMYSCLPGLIEGCMCPFQVLLLRPGITEMGKG
jgi:hypothetical protein